MRVRVGAKSRGASGQDWQEEVEGGWLDDDDLARLDWAYTTLGTIIGMKVVGYV